MREYRKRNTKYSFSQKVTCYNNRTIKLLKKVSKRLKYYKTGVYNFSSKRELKKAVLLWCSNRERAHRIYGHISYWDTYYITDMSSLFRNQINFNDNISEWNTSNVINMRNMFRDAKKFNQHIGEWDTSSVTCMCGMLCGANSFNKPIYWDTSSVTDMSLLFCEASNFNHPLTLNTQKVSTMSFMFNDASSLRQPLNFRNTQNVEYECLNENTRKFEKCSLEIFKKDMFEGCPISQDNQPEF